MNPELAWMVGVIRTGWKARFVVRPAAAIPVVPNAVEGLIWPFFLAFGRTPPVGSPSMHPHRTLHARAGGGCGRSSAMSRRISWDICRGMATSAIWKAT